MPEKKRKKKKIVNCLSSSLLTVSEGKRAFDFWKKDKCSRTPISPVQWRWIRKLKFGDQSNLYCYGGGA